MNLTRKILAAVLALLAALVAAWPAPAGVELAVAARDLPAGVPLAPEDLKTIEAPPGLSPAGAISREAAEGRALRAAARSGEPLTDTRLLPAEADTASVAVRLADPAVGALLRTGSQVDVVGPDRQVLADDASVVAVRDAEVVLLSTSHEAATRVAAESLTHPVALTLR
ncbi:SAF domain-containing protein [Saccharothrix australiensis]|uniref:SAF domain-containing protein n=1 Tax=Saccharothrix australiensis TaxID=2072 RepID=A0A495VXV9_9PSEU|nr:SAF domain-containing protein [Saccharothrix australiensis]RKT52458.1 SAF domain-containing protein [Saccharothrix australiensis]